jgi:hypothetical protein
MPKKGNRNSMATAPGAPKDTQAAFPQVVFGEERPYKVRPYVEIEGIFFDVAPRTLGIVPGAEKAKKAPAARKARTRRQDPGAGTRPSLSTMRRKG